MSIERPVLRYHGGKFLLAPFIIENMPPHRIYVEPFGGAASVLMRKARSFAEIYNDKWSTVTNVFQVLRDREQSAELERLLRLTPFARDEFERTNIDDDLPPAERARRTILRSFAGFGSASINGEHSTGFRANSNRSHSTPAHGWARYPDHIASFTARLTAVVIENRPAIEVIQQHDGDDTLVYCDPPYVHSTRNMRRGNAAYAMEMRNEDHEALAAVLHECKGMVMVSGYRCELYDGLFRDWERREINTTADGRRPRIETLWLNDACVTRQTQMRMFA